MVVGGGTLLPGSTVAKGGWRPLVAGSGVGFDDSRWREVCCRMLVDVGPYKSYATSSYCLGLYRHSWLRLQTILMDSPLIG